MRKVYDGYDEKLLNGRELKEMFKDCFYQGRGRQGAVYDITIPEYLDATNIKEDFQYRIFYSRGLCIIFKADTDGKVDDFRYVNITEKNNYLKNRSKVEHRCKLCNSDMLLRHGAYGLFWSCKDYPNCKGSEKAMILGNFISTGFKFGSMFADD